MTIPQLLAAANMAAGLTLIGLGVALPSAELIGEWRQQMESIVDMTANQVRLVCESLDDVNSAKIAEATQAPLPISRRMPPNSCNGRASISPWSTPPQKRCRGLPDPLKVLIRYSMPRRSME